MGSAGPVEKNSDRRWIHNTSERDLNDDATLRDISDAGRARADAVGFVFP